MYGKTMRSVVLIILLTWSAAWASPEAPKRNTTVVVRVPAASVANAAAAGVVPERVYDYGSFQWLELSSDEFERLAASNAKFRVERDPFTIRLGETSFDPRESGPSLPDEWKLDATAGPDLHLVQFDGPPRQEWLDSLERQNLKIVQYIHPRTYIVWGEMADRAAVETVEPSVRWSGPFEPGFRVLPRWRNLDERGQDVKVMLYRGADTNAALGALEALGGRVMGRRIINPTFEVVSVTLPGARFNAAGKIPGVYSIQVTPTDGGLRGEMTDQINVNNVNGSNAAFPGYQTWLAGVGLDGNGVIIANVDGGVQDNHPDLVNRFLPCSGSTCGGSAIDAHGTHTAGIMAADGSSGTTDGAGFLRGLGVAPGANLVEQVYSPTYVQPGGMLLLMTQSFNNGASLSGNSWGPSGSPLGYDNDTLQVDQGVRDADPNAAGDQSFTYVLSFMNGYGGTSTQGTPDEAKNIFNIGSTKAQNGNLTQILAINDISANSAHGPALDGRTIPHMVAPGCSVDSTISGSTYGTMCGTSMASPHVSGAVALFIEYYRNLPTSPPDPSPALVKAAFLPVAKDLAGFRDADGGILGHPFDSKQGWGRMDLEAVVDPQLSVLYFDNPQVFDNTGEEWSITVSPADPAEPMKIMLVWTDAIGHGLGGSTPAWNNDLDLVVEAGADTYLGNVFGGDGWSETGGTADFRNNTEGVLLSPTLPATATIRVVASDINSDGVPGTGSRTDQDFALVCYNCTLLVPPLAVDALTRNRYLVFQPSNDVDVTSYQVQLGASDTYPGATMTKWVGVPDSKGRAPLSDTQVSRIWREDVIRVADCGIVPASTYLLRSTINGVDFSDPLVLNTTLKPAEGKHWGDCVGTFDGTAWAPPNGTINIDDVVGAIQTFQDLPMAPPVDWTDVHPEQPNLLVNIVDVQFLILAFQGHVYPFSSPEVCP